MPAAGNVRLIAHHVASAPAVDLLVPGRFASKPLLWVPGVANISGANQATGEIPATQAQISVLPASGNRPVFTRIIQAHAGLTYTAYAVGSLTNGTSTIIVQPIGGLPDIDVRF